MLFARLTILVIALSIATATLADITPQSSPSQRVTATELIPLTSSTKEFKIIDGKDQGSLVPMTFRADPKDGRSWQLRFGDYGSVSLRSSSGELFMERLDLFKSKSYVIYEPALRVLPEDIETGGPVVRQSRYKMYSGETGKLKRAGRVTHVVKRISRSRFSTPAGLIDGYQIEMEHKMEMEYQSQLLLAVSLGCGLDDGLVYGSTHYRLSKLGGLLTETKTSSAALSRRSIASSF
jgi:hypothetical protein